MIEIFYLENGLKRGTLSDISVKKTRWIDITNITKEESEKIHAEFNLHQLTTEDLINSNVRVKVEEFDNYLFCVFYALRKTKNVSLIEMDFIIGKDFIISNHKEYMFKELKNNDKKIQNLLGKGCDFIMHRLIDIEVDNYMPVLETIDANIEKIEEQATKSPNPQLLSEILNLKRQINRIKKIALPQREKISTLTKNDYSQIKKKTIPFFRDLYDHAVRVSDTIDNYREAVGSTFDAYMSAVSNNMNEVMKTLSIIATIALPLTVISGIYGTNFISLPGSTYQYGFWIMIGLMMAMGIGMLIFFRSRKWF